MPFCQWPAINPGLLAGAERDLLADIRLRLVVMVGMQAKSPEARLALTQAKACRARINNVENQIEVREGVLDQPASRAPAHSLTVSSFIFCQLIH